MLDIRTLSRNQQDGMLEFKKVLDLSHIKIWGSNPFLKPVEVSGKLKELYNGYQLDYKVNYTSAMPCARCLTQVERGFSLSFSHFLREAQEDSFDEDFVIMAKEKIDLTELVSSDIILDMDENPLCKSDCKGICMICGADLNLQECDCKPEEFKDPRFDSLRELLGK